MRIVCAVHHYPPRHETGSARFASQLCRRLAARGHRVRVVSSTRPGRAPQGGSTGGVVVQPMRRGLRTAWSRHVRHPLRGPLGGDEFGLAGPLASELRRRIRRARPERILALAASTQEVVAAAQCVRRWRVPGIVVPFFHIHAPDFARERGRWLEVLGSFDRVVAVSEEERAFLAAHGIPGRRIARARMFVETPSPLSPEEVRTWRRRRGIGDALLVVAGGGCAEAKGAWTLARASRALPDVRFVLFGGDARARRRLEAATAPGPNLQLIGPISEREKSLWLHAADLLAMPSRGDAFGLTYIEANACGTPALAADLPAMREVLGPDGLFVPPDDPVALARAIRSRSPARWRSPELAEAARRNAARFAFEAALDRFLDLVERPVTAA